MSGECRGEPLTCLSRDCTLPACTLPYPEAVCVSQMEHLQRGRCPILCAHKLRLAPLPTKFSPEKGVHRPSTHGPSCGCPCLQHLRLCLVTHRHCWACGIIAFRVLVVSDPGTPTQCCFLTLSGSSSESLGSRNLSLGLPAGTWHFLPHHLSLKHLLIINHPLILKR